MTSLKKQTDDPRLTDDGREFYDVFVQLTREQKLEAAARLRAMDPVFAELADDIESVYRDREP